LFDFEDDDLLGFERRTAFLIGREEEDRQDWWECNRGVEEREVGSPLLGAWTIVVGVSIESWLRLLLVGKADVSCINRSVGVGVDMFFPR
jgi:hypothetical protein